MSKNFRHYTIVYSMVWYIKIHFVYFCIDEGLIIRKHI